jgi:hypothetical protein
MPKVSPIQNSFNAGELSPNLAGRTDFDKYRSGCFKLENVIPLVQGPGEARPGTHYAAEVKTSTEKTWAIPFHFNQSQSYVIEIGHQYMRWFTQRGQLLDGGTGLPYEINTAPIVGSDLTNTDGTFAPSFVQSGDSMFFAHTDYFPHLLERFGHTDWRMRNFGLPGLPAVFEIHQYVAQWPYGAMNQDTNLQFTVSAVTGAINLTAFTGAIFQAWMVGCQMMIEQGLGSLVRAWEVGKAVVANDLRRVDSRVYRCTVAGTTGSVRPTHTTGKRKDGDPGAEWLYVHSGFGHVRIETVIDAAHATATVLTELPGELVTVPTSRFQIQAWNENDRYPTVVGFGRERMIWIRNNQFWMSAPGDFFNYAERDLNGDVTADQAIFATLASDTADPIRWCRETPQGILLGTDGGEWLVAEANNTDPFGPGNVRATFQSAYGSRAIAPIKVQQSLLFVQRGGRKLRESIWGIDTETTKSRDVTVLSDHITRSGITSMCFQQEPRSTLWATRYDGVMLSFTYNNEQDVYGWHRHPVGGNGLVECVVSIPSPDGSQDDLWMIVRRTIAGVEKRYVEWLDEGHAEGEDVVNAWYVDCGAAYEGTPVASVSGLDFLEGMTVDVLADGSPQVPKVVTAGAIAVDPPASKVIAGLPYRSVIGTMRRDEGAADGTAQGKLKRVHELAVRFHETVGAKVGPSEDQLDTITFRDTTMPMGGPITPFTGDKIVPYNGSWERDGRVYVVRDQPLPMTVVSIMPRLTTND